LLNYNIGKGDRLCLLKNGLIHDAVSREAYIADILIADGKIKAITINPAEHIGVADRVGSIEVGKDADIVVCDGSPFEIATRVEYVLIDGNIVSDHPEFK